MKPFCYIASPYGAIKNALEPLVWKELARNYALKGAKEAKVMGFIPLSPVLLFWDVYDEDSEREEVIEAGIRLLRKCECFLNVITPYTAKSEGVKKEVAIAKEIGLKIYKIF